MKHGAKHAPRSARAETPAAAPDPGEGGRPVRDRDTKSVAPPKAKAQPAPLPALPAAVPPHLRELHAALDACWALAEAGQWCADADKPLRHAVAGLRARLGEGDQADRQLAHTLLDWLVGRMGQAQAAGPAGLQWHGPYFVTHAIGLALGGLSMPAACRDAWLDGAPVDRLRNPRTGNCLLTEAFVHALCGVDPYPRTGAAPTPAQAEVEGCTYRGQAASDFRLIHCEDLLDRLPTQPGLVVALTLPQTRLDAADVDRITGWIHAQGASADPSEWRRATALVTRVLCWSSVGSPEAWARTVRPYLAGAFCSPDPYLLVAACAGVFDAQQDLEGLLPSTQPWDHHVYVELVSLLVDWLPYASPVVQIALGAVLAQGLVRAPEAEGVVAGADGADGADGPDEASRLLEAGAYQALQVLLAPQGEQRADDLHAGVRSISPQDGTFGFARGLAAGAHPAGLLVADCALRGRYGLDATIDALAPLRMDERLAVVRSLARWLVAQLDAAAFVRLQQALVAPGEPAVAAQVDGKAARPQPVAGGPGADPAPAGPEAPARAASPEAAAQVLLDWLDAYAGALDLDGDALSPGAPLTEADWARHAANFDAALAFWRQAGEAPDPKPGPSAPRDMAPAIARVGAGTNDLGEAVPGKVIRWLDALRRALEALRPAAEAPWAFEPPPGAERPPSPAQVGDAAPPDQR